MQIEADLLLIALDKRIAKCQELCKTPGPDGQWEINVATLAALECVRDAVREACDDSPTTRD